MSTYCTELDHDHYDEDRRPMVCVDCGQPAHYSEEAGTYLHDDTEHSCWLHGPGRGCTLAERPALRWDSEAWQWVDAGTGEALSFDTVEQLGLDATGRALG